MDYNGHFPGIRWSAWIPPVLLPVLPVLSLVSFLSLLTYSSLFHSFKAKWKVSIAAMIMRCEVLGLLTQNQIKYLKDQMTKRVYWRTEPLDNTTPVERPYAHKQAVKLLLENNIISPSKFIEDTGCLKEELEEYCFLDKGMLDIKEDSNVIKLRRVQ